MRRVWQDTCKPGEYSPTKGKWFAQESVDGHLRTYCAQECAAERKRIKAYKAKQRAA